MSVCFLLCGGMVGRWWGYGILCIVQLVRAPRGFAGVCWWWRVVPTTIGAVGAGGVAVVRRGLPFLIYLSRVVCFAGVIWCAMRWGFCFWDNGQCIPREGPSCSYDNV